MVRVLLASTTALLSLLAFSRAAIYETTLPVGDKGSSEPDLCELVEKGDVPAVNGLLASGSTAHVACKDPIACSPLHAAVIKRNYDVGAARRFGDHDTGVRSRSNG
jgi:hypothetical protein